MLFNYADARTEARWVRVNKLYTLKDCFNLVCYYQLCSSRYSQYKWTRLD